MNRSHRIPNKNKASGVWSLSDIRSYILNGNWPKSFYETDPPKILSSNYYTEAGLGDNFITTFLEHVTVTGVLS
jgi:hypothetical protein